MFAPFQPIRLISTREHSHMRRRIKTARRPPPSPPPPLLVFIVQGRRRSPLLCPLQPISLISTSEHSHMRRRISRLSLQHCRRFDLHTDAAHHASGVNIFKSVNFLSFFKQNLASQAVYLALHASTCCVLCFNDSIHVENESCFCGTGTFSGVDATPVARGLLTLERRQWDPASTPSHVPTTAPMKRRISSSNAHTLRLPTTGHAA